MDPTFINVHKTESHPQTEIETENQPRCRPPEDRADGLVMYSFHGLLWVVINKCYKLELFYQLTFRRSPPTLSALFVCTCCEISKGIPFHINCLQNWNSQITRRLHCTSFHQNPIIINHKSDLPCNVRLSILYVHLLHEWQNKTAAELLLLKDSPPMSLPFAESQLTYSLTHCCAGEIDTIAH